MEMVRFIFWEAVKVLALIFLGLFSSKGITALKVGKPWIKPLLYAVVVILAGVGAWEAGTDVAAEVYMWTCNSDLGHGNLIKAYSNALRAVNLRPNNLTYWHVLVKTKMDMQQLSSALDDEAAVRELSDGALDEVDEYQFALCAYFLGQYDQVEATTLRLIRQNPSYAAPYVLQGMAYTAGKKYAEAQQSYIAVLNIFPNNQAAVEGLARALYLAGDRQKALFALQETAKVPFSPAARQRFEALKGLYDQ